MTRPRRSLAELRALSRNMTIVGPPGGENAAADWIQQLVDDTVISDRAPGDVRAAVDVAVALHVYGMFSWSFFAVAVLQSRLTRELALGIRFGEFYGGRIPLEKRDRGRVVATDVLETSQVETVRWHLGHQGSHRRRDHWQLVGHADFDGSLASLYRWAKSESLLRPWLDHLWARRKVALRDAVFLYGLVQAPEPPLPARPVDFADWTDELRDHWFEHEFRDGWEEQWIRREVEVRNDAAHPTMQAVFMPTWSASEIEALALFVNLLWPTPSSSE